jgi:membrane protease YdiL (CAAX protease family)
MSLLGALAWTSAFWMLEQVCAGVTNAVRPGARADIVSLAGFSVLATSLIVFAMVRVHAPEASLRATLGVRPLAPMRGLLAVAAGAGLRPPMSVLEDVIARRWPHQDAEVAESLRQLVATSSRISLVVCVFVVMPVASELFFRGIVFGELRRATSSWVALVGTTALFALSYSMPDARELPTAAVLGFAFGWTRARCGTVVAPVVAHVAFWAVEGIPILRGRDPAADVVYPVKWVVGGAVIAALALAVIGTGSEERKRARG